MPLWHLNQLIPIWLYNYRIASNMNQPAEKRERKKIIKSLNLLAINRPFYEIGYRAVVKFNGHQIQNTQRRPERGNFEMWLLRALTATLWVWKIRMLAIMQRDAGNSNAQIILCAEAKKLASHKTNHLLTDLNYIWADAQFFFCTHSPVIACWY
jgi:hypothetical protein